jgi:hypothetical protein
LPGFFNFVEDAIDILPTAEEKARDRAPRFSGFTRQRATVWKLFQGIQAVNEFLEPLWPSD